MTRLALVVLMAASAVAQTNNPEAVRKVVDVKHLSGDRADRAMRLIGAYMHPVGSINFDQALRTAVLIGPEKVVTGAEALLAKFDSPGAIRPDRQIQLRIHLVEALQEAGGASIPPEIAPAVEQMRKNFAYKGYRLVDTLSVMGKDGVIAAGVLSGEAADPKNYVLRVQSSSVLEDGKTVALKNFSLEMRRRDGPLTSIQTDLTIQQGQKLVVGKLAQTPLNAIFLILTVDVL